MTCNRALVAIERLCGFAQQGNESAIRAAWDCAVKLAETVQHIAQTPPTGAAFDCLKSCGSPEIWMPVLWAQRTALNADFPKIAANLELGKDSPFNASSGNAHLTTPLAVFLRPMITRFHRIHRQIEWHLDHPVGTTQKKATNPDFLDGLRKQIAVCDTDGVPVEEALRNCLKEMENFKGPTYATDFQHQHKDAMKRIVEMVTKNRGKLTAQIEAQIKQALPGNGAVPHWQRPFFIGSYYLRTLCPMQKSNADTWASVIVEYIFINEPNPDKIDGLKGFLEEARQRGRKTTKSFKSYLEDKISRTLEGILSENNPSKPIPTVKQSESVRGQQPVGRMELPKEAFC
jgi:hypothetical protein